MCAVLCAVLYTVYCIVFVTYCLSCVMGQERTSNFVAPEVQAGLLLSADIVCVLCCVVYCVVCNFML